VSDVFYFNFSAIVFFGEKKLKYMESLSKTMKKALFCLLVVSLFLYGCGGESQEVTCNKPYILVGNDCCLDKDDNSICDKDETIIPNEESDKKALRALAEEFSIYYEAGDWEAIYEISTPERRSQREKGDFIKLANNIFGKEGAYGLEFRDSMVIDDKGYVTFYESYLGEESISPKFYFKKVDEKWYYDGFTWAFMFGCFTENECMESPYLLDTCQKTCAEEDKRLRIDDEKKFKCRGSLCNCVCWDDSADSGNVVEPNVKFVHQD